MNNKRSSLLLALPALALLSHSANAILLTPVDLNSLTLGANIVGPVGPTVEASFVNGSSESLGDIRSGVACPGGFATCAPASNPAGTIYTYVYEIAPGIDAFPNDAPFPQPPLAAPAFDNVTEFHLDFSPGSNGVAGFDFGQASSALGAGADFQIELLNDSLSWTVSGGISNWNTGEIIRFFWQTTQAPTGPGNIYGIDNSLDAGGAVGPSPAPLAAAPTPGSLLLLSTLLPGLAWMRRRRVGIACL